MLKKRSNISNKDNADVMAVVHEGVLARHLQA